MESIARWVRHNQAMAVALTISTGVMVWTLGCQSKVSSMFGGEKLVTAEELNLEIQQLSGKLDGELDMLLAQAELKMADLKRQDEIKQKLFEFAQVTANAGQFNPTGLITLIGSFIGVGAVVDNRIKDKVIKNRPKPS
jgi:hypothetical protein